MVRTLRKLGIEENFFNLIKKKSMKNLQLMYNIIIDYKSIIMINYKSIINVSILSICDCEQDKNGYSPHFYLTVYWRPYRGKKKKQNI